MDLLSYRCRGADCFPHLQRTRRIGVPATAVSYPFSPALLGSFRCLSQWRCKIQSHYHLHQLESELRQIRIVQVLLNQPDRSKRISSEAMDPAPCGCCRTWIETKLRWKDSRIASCGPHHSLSISSMAGYVLPPDGKFVSDWVRFAELPPTAPAPIASCLLNSLFSFSDESP